MDDYGFGVIDESYDFRLKSLQQEIPAQTTQLIIDADDMESGGSDVKDMWAQMARRAVDLTDLTDIFWKRGAAWQLGIFAGALDNIDVCSLKNFEVMATPLFGNDSY